VNELIEIEVAYALPKSQILECLKVPFGTTVAQAVQLSGICKKIPEIQPDNKNLGVFGKLVKPETVLRNHDRVEIYRPITVDPKEKRRKRVEKVIASNKRN
jgi:putative ubiquitin-RnfH superfamily antitoxin RatB of RatAB toxin-antitoxin module